MRRIKEKLRSSGGESLLEALVAVLVLTFSCLMLYFSAVTASKLNKTALQMDTQYHSELNHAEGQSGPSDSEGTVTVFSKNPLDASAFTKEVAVYGRSGELTSYRLPIAEEES